MGVGLSVGRETKIGSQSLSSPVTSETAPAIWGGEKDPAEIGSRCWHANSQKTVVLSDTTEDACRRKQMRRRVSLDFRLRVVYSMDALMQSVA